MYRLDWIEQLKLRTAARPSAPLVSQVNPVVWKLGATSLLTDISAEMVNSALPVYLVLHLHMSPLQYGAIDGVYNGLSMALIGLMAGLFADRTRRQKHVCAMGYAVSAVCKLLLLAAAGAWNWILAIVWLDRTGKGMRTAPRDALISLNTSAPLLATAFAVHRTLDAGGSLVGPLVAVGLLWALPGAFDVLWVASFTIAILGLAVIVLFVPNPHPVASSPDPKYSSRAAFNLLFTRRFGTLAGCGLLLSTLTISDGFVYLLLRERGGTNASFFPLFYVVTACFYMLFSIPIGRGADRYGRVPTLLAGYVCLGLIYALLLLVPNAGMETLALCLCLFGLYYAATEGVLVAMASAVVPPEIRTSGLAILLSVVGIGKLVSSLLFGWIWQSYGAFPSVLVFGAGLVAALPIAGFLLGASRNA
jgi:MFS family permease